MTDRNRPAHERDDIATAISVLEARRSVHPTFLGAPGPDAAALRRLVTIGARVPDHGALCPWRFIIVEGDAQWDLSRRLSALFDAQNSDKPADLRANAARKFETMFAKAPVVVIVVSRADAAARIPEWEQVLSAGAVCMNLMLAATALGYGANWLTGWAAYDRGALDLIGLGPNEKVAGIIPIGTVRERPPERPRPSLSAIMTSWAAP